MTPTEFNTIAKHPIESTNNLAKEMRPEVGRNVSTRGINDGVCA
jgi:hypothetical protein